MAICPKCKKVIDKLEYSRTDYNSGTYNLKEGYEEDGNSNLIEGDVFFICPECNEELFTQEGEATEFLENKDEFQEIVAEKLAKLKNEN